jgi:succinoglycan biosynthesis protein ExoW
LSIAVVIPFYQREPGILARCLNSILAQQTSPGVDFQIVIIDDASPMPLEGEVAGLDIPAPHQLFCLKRPNGGPGAARNTGLDFLRDRSPDFVAFIDSDDEWRPSHVQRALDIMGDDADFYFCDHDRWNYRESWFEGSKQIQDWMADGDAPFIRRPDAGAEVFEFKNHEAFRAFILDYMAQTSTVMFRQATGERVRFDPALRHAGEDNMFWLQLCALARKVRLSCEKNVVTGAGVNMFAKSVNWSHPEAAQRAAAVVKFFLTIKGTFKLDNRDTRLVSDRLARYESEFAKIWARKLIRSPFAAMEVLAELLKLDGGLLLRLPGRIVSPLIEG